MTSTSFLAQLIGLFLLCVGASMLFQQRVFLKVLSDITGDRTALFVAGLVLLFLGLLVVLSHNLWRAGFLPLVITLIGWILILRGLSSMFLPDQDMARLIRWFKVEEYSRLYAILVLVIGACLTMAGFWG